MSLSCRSPKLRSTHPRVLSKLVLQLQSYRHGIGEENGNEASHEFKRHFVRGTVHADGRT